jgi:hypothetical protein
MTRAKKIIKKKNPKRKTEKTRKRNIISKCSLKASQYIIIPDDSEKNNSEKLLQKYDDFLVLVKCDNLFMINFLDNNMGDQRQTDVNEMKEDSHKKIETPKTPQKKKNNKTKMKKKLYETNDISRITTRVFDDNKTPKSDSYPEFISQVKKEDVVQSINFDVIRNISTNQDYGPDVISQSHLIRFPISRNKNG